MKRKYLLVLLFPCVLFSQKKYQSLLWEITGNHLKKSSYLYGTMHVSDKVAFHLSDAFFERLKSCDMVATESDPQDWLEEFEGPMDYNYDYYYNSTLPFYQKLTREAVKKNDIPILFKYNEYMVDGVLYRKNIDRKNFQESTYIDMFIFQAGKKLNKKTFGLENFKESEELAMKGFKSQRYQPPKPYVKKLLNGKSVNEGIEDAYRLKDLDLLDSLQKGTSSEGLMKYLLYERNINMVDAMDSLMKKGSLFAAVGAGHLPGNEGMIELLRKKGYTVKPIIDKYSDKGKSEMEKIESIIKPIKLQQVNSNDNFYQIKSPNKLLDFLNEKKGELSIALDISNGGYLTTGRVTTFDFLNQNKFTFETIDSLLYENIPGKIFLKEPITLNGFQGLNIASKTETGDINRYKIFMTPLDILAFGVSGKKEYANVMGVPILNSLSLKPITSNWIDFSPFKGGYEVKIPSFYSHYESNENSKNPKSPQIYAYDPSDQSYYWIVNEVLDDMDFEDTKFELQRIIEEFDDKTDNKAKITKVELKPIATAEGNYKLKNNKTVYLKTIINGANYYLMGTTSANENNRNKFFKSFQNTSFKNIVKKELQTDSLVLFELKMPYKIKHNSYYDEYAYEDEIDYIDDDDDENTYANESSSIKSENGENILIYYEKNEKYKLKSDSIDFQKSVLNPMLKKECDVKIDFIKKGNYNDGYKYYDYELSDTLSTQIIKNRYYHKDDKLYTIQYLGKKGKEENPFFKEVIETIKFIPEKKKEKKEKDLKDKNDELEEYISEEELQAADSLSFAADSLEAAGYNDDYDDFKKYKFESNKNLFNKYTSLKHSTEKLNNFLKTYNFQLSESEIMDKAFNSMDMDSVSIDDLNYLYKKYPDRVSFTSLVLTEIIKKDKEKGLNQTVNYWLKYKPTYQNRLWGDFIYEIKEQKNYEDFLFPKSLKLLNNTNYSFKLMNILGELHKENKLKPKHFQSKTSYIQSFIDKEIKDFRDYYTSSHDVSGFDYGDVENALNVLNILDNKSPFNKSVETVRETKIPEFLEVLLKLDKPVKLSESEFAVLEQNPDTKTFAEQKKSEIIEGKKPNKVTLNQAIDFIKDSDYNISEDSIILKEEKIITLNDKKYQVFLFDVFSFNSKKDKQKYKKDSLYFSSNKEGNVKLLVYDLNKKDSIDTKKKCYPFTLPIDEKKNKDDDEYKEDEYDFNSDSIVAEVIAEARYDAYNKSEYNVILEESVPIFSQKDVSELYNNLNDFLKYRDKKRAYFKIEDKKNDYYY